VSFWSLRNADRFLLASRFSWRHWNVCLTSFSGKRGLHQIAQPCQLTDPSDLISDHFWYSGVASLDSIIWRHVSLNSVITKGESQHSHRSSQHIILLVATLELRSKVVNRRWIHQRYSEAAGANATVPPSLLSSSACVLTAYDTLSNCSSAGGRRTTLY
jgi:hypothetical protein